jgi:hypothetical protein
MATKRTVITYPPEFEQFWQHYPRRRRGNKSHALRAFTEQVDAGLPTGRELLTMLDAFINSPDWQKNGGQYIPGPTVWLRKEKWRNPPKSGQERKPHVYHRACRNGNATNEWKGFVDYGWIATQNQNAISAYVTILAHIRASGDPLYEDFDELNPVWYTTLDALRYLSGIPHDEFLDLIVLLDESEWIQFEEIPDRHINGAPVFRISLQSFRRHLPFSGTYDDYINSDRWQRMRWRKLLQQPRCQLCYHDRNLHVHHRTYENLGQESLDDLIVLCKTCHERHHNKQNGGAQ